MKRNETINILIKCLYIFIFRYFDFLNIYNQIVSLIEYFIYSILFKIIQN